MTELRKVLLLTAFFLISPSLIVAIGLLLGFGHLSIILGLVFLALPAIGLILVDFKLSIVIRFLILVAISFAYSVVTSLIYFTLLILREAFANLSNVLTIILAIGLLVLFIYAIGELVVFINIIFNGIDLSGQVLTGRRIRNKYLRKANLSRSILNDEDLSGKNLSYANLSAADLSNANLHGANLGYADLRGANLVNTSLNGANLSYADLSGANLVNTNLNGANLSYADLSGANLVNTNLNGANLSYADLSGANLSGKDLSGVNLRAANLNSVDFSAANLSRANLNEASLIYARLNEANVKGANFEGCKVFGIAAWGLNDAGSNQSNLVITKENEPTITVDGLSVANLIYLMLQGDPIKNVLDTLTAKSVLILGRFTNERLEVLRAVQKELRKYNYVPILFDFEKPANRNIIETVSTIAHLSRFIIADLTEPQAIPGELTRIIPNLIVPVIPIFQPSTSKQTEWGMFWDFRDYNHVLSIFDYDNISTLLENMHDKIILPAEDKVMEISKIREKNQKEKMERREKNFLPTVDRKGNGS